MNMCHVNVNSNESNLTVTGEPPAVLDGVPPAKEVKRLEEILDHQPTLSTAVIKSAVSASGCEEKLSNVSTMTIPLLSRCSI